MLAHFSFVHAAPLSSAPPSVPSSPSSQSEASTVAEVEPTVPQDGEGEKCASVHCDSCVSQALSGRKGEFVLVVVVAERGVVLVHEAKSYKLFSPS